MLLASGATQHAFTENVEDKGPVYKIPAIFDRFLPTPPVKAILRVLTDDGVLGPAAALYLRWQRIRGFKRMLSMLDYLHSRGVTEVLLPCTWHRSKRLLLHAGEYQYRYEGPVLVQQRAEHFFASPHNLTRFDWAELVSAQEELWRNGIALSDAAGVLGPNGWALHDGRLKLADTGSLTRDRNHAIAVHQERILASVRERWTAKHSESSERLHAYMEFVFPRVRANRLALIWGTSNQLEGESKSGFIRE